MRSAARTVREYLAELPADRRKAISAVRKVIRENLPDGYDEAMNWGMITYQVPLATYPDTYNGQPLMYAALASQKNHMAVYLTGIYISEGSRAAFEGAYRATGKRFDVDSRVSGSERWTTCRCRSSVRRSRRCRSRRWSSASARPRRRARHARRQPRR